MFGLVWSSIAGTGELKKKRFIETFLFFILAMTQAFHGSAELALAIVSAKVELIEDDDMTHYRENYLER